MELYNWAHLFSAIFECRHVTAYSDVYGQHPRTFDFDNAGNKIDRACSSDAAFPSIRPTSHLGIGDALNGGGALIARLYNSECNMLARRDNATLLVPQSLVAQGLYSARLCDLCPGKRV